MIKYTDEDKETLVLSRLIRYADHHADFDRTFIDKIYDFMELNDYISDGQLQVLNRIYDQNNIKDFFNEY